MKYLSTLLFAFFACVIFAQPTINFDLSQSIGQEWGEGIAEDFPIDELPPLLGGENVVWDYTFLGELDNGFGMIFNEAEMEDFFPVSFQDLNNFPLVDGGTAQDSFPTGGGAFVGGDNPNDYEWINIVGQNNDGVVFLEELQSNGGLTYELNDEDSSMFYPLGLEYGESFTFSDLSTGTGYSTTHGETTSNFFTADTFTYFGNGVLKMYYGDVDNVVLISQKRKYHYESYSVATGELIFEDYDYYMAYFFQQNGNLLPLVYFRYYAQEDWSPATLDVDIAVFIPYSPIINNSKENTLQPFNFTISPNPSSDKLSVTYFLEKPTDIKWSLYDLSGRLIMDDNCGIKTSGEHLEEIILPEGMPLGNYFFKIKAGGKVGTEKIMVKK